MKKTHIPLYFLLSFPLSASAQQSRCSSTEYLKALEARDPGLAQRRQQQEAVMQHWIAANSNEEQRTTVIIPVVFHVLYNDSSQYLDDSVIQSQLDVINEDYRRNNGDSNQTPLAFRALAADCEFEFCLAQRTPAGLPTDGIIQKYTSVSAFSDYDKCKFNIYGGDDAWDASRYMNIWVAAFTNPNFLGLGTFPNSVSPEYDGIVINYKACGRIGTHLMPQYNRGRSLTHEIGHWLSLIHIWGDDGTACTGEDLITDTPLQASETYGCPSYPKTDNCAQSFPGIMFMNFLDYTDDECMNMFTQGQKFRMLSALNNDRSSILGSNGCSSVDITEMDLKNYFSAYPNPVSGNLIISCSMPGGIKGDLSLVNVLGKTVRVIQSQSDFSSQTTVDISSIPSGIYFLKVSADGGEAAYKIVKQ